MVAMGILMAEPRARWADLGDEIARVRLAAGLTQQQLAKAIGKSTGYIGRIESGGERRPSAEVLQAIAKACEADYFPLGRAANYIPKLPPGQQYETITVPTTKAGLVRQLIEWTDDFAVRVVQSARIWGSESVPPQPAPNHQPAEEDTPKTRNTG